MENYSKAATNDYLFKIGQRQPHDPLLTVDFYFERQ